MTLKQLVYLIGIATLLLWGGWLWSLFNFDPTLSGILGFVFFYFTLFLSLTGTISLLGLFARKMNKKYNIIFYTVVVSFRQALILSALVISLLLLQSFRVMRWWNVLIIFILVVALETIILVRQKKRNIETPLEEVEANPFYAPAPKFESNKIEY